MVFVKKLIKFIIGLVLFLVFTAIIIISVLGIILYDNSHKGEKTNITTSDVISNINYDALETSNDNKLSYTLDVLTLNDSRLYLSTRSFLPISSRYRPIIVWAVFSSIGKDGV